MASNAPASEAGKNGPLSFMTKLSPCVYIYRPSNTGDRSVSTPAAESVVSARTTPHQATTTPKFILLATWMGARDPHIAKYVLPYQALFPSAQILLIRSELRHFAPLMRGRTAASDISPAVPVLRSFVNEIPSGENGRPEMLVHIWSNGGSSSLSLLHKLLLSKYPDLEFPRHTIVFDSCPGQFSYWPGYKVAMTGIPPWRWLRFIVSPFIHALTAWTWVLYLLIGKRWKRFQGLLAELSEGHNDLVSPGNRAGREVCRTYVYSDTDELINSTDIEEHAADAKRKGLKVRMEKFEGSQHVAHVRADEGRYWRVVKETWEGTD